MSLRQQVLSCLESEKEISTGRVCARLGLHQEGDKRRVDNAFRQLALLGKCCRIKTGVYRSAPMPDNPPKTQRKIWKAMWNEKTFTLDKIELLAGPVYRGYLERYVKYTKRQGLVRIAGKNGKVPFYRLTGKATPQVPIYQRPRQRSDRPGWREELSHE